MSISHAVDNIINGLNLAQVKEIAGKALHAVLDLVAGKAETAGSELLVAEAAKLGVTVTPEQAAKLIHVVLGHVRDHA